MFSGKEYWIGLRMMYWLTQQKSYKLRIKMRDFNGEMKTANYSTFQITENVRSFVGRPMTTVLKV